MLNSCPLRNIAREEAEIGFAHLARAFNFTKNPKVPYVWGNETLERFEKLAKEIVVLIEHGEIVPRSGAIAQDDSEFQKFLGSLMR